MSELWTSWLDSPPERAVIEARIEGDQHDAVDQVLRALRERGFEAIFHPDDVKEMPGGPLPTWTPQ